MPVPPSFTYSGVTYVGTGSQTEFPLTSSTGNAINYLLPEHITVSTSSDEGANWTVLNSPADYTFSTQGTRVVLATAPVVGDWVLLQRNTPMDENWVDYQAGNLLTAGQLNEFESWQLYIDQELEDTKSNIDGTVPGAAVKGIAGVDPIQVDSTNSQVPSVSIDEVVSTDDPNDLTSDTQVMSALAADNAFSVLLGTGENYPPVGTTGRIGKVRIDNQSTTYNRAFFWNGSAWVQLGVPQGPPGDPGPPPGLQDPAAIATTVPPKADGTVGDATAFVSQDPDTFDIQFLFGIPQGVKGDKGDDGDKGDKGDPGDSVTYLGMVDATTDTEPSNPGNGDFYINTGDGSSTWAGLSTVEYLDRLVWSEANSVWDRYEAPPEDPNTMKRGDDVSWLNNDAGYITASQVPAAPVTSVNGATGAVALGLDEILAQGNTSGRGLTVGATGTTVQLTSAGAISAHGKITSASTVAGDSATTVTTKDYVDNAVTNATPDLSGYVTLAGTETITGAKTFSTSQIFDGNNTSAIAINKSADANYSGISFTQQGTTRWILYHDRYDNGGSGNLTIQRRDENGVVQGAPFVCSAVGNEVTIPNLNSSTFTAGSSTNYGKFRVTDNSSVSYRLEMNRAESGGDSLQALAVKTAGTTVFNVQYNGKIATGNDLSIGGVIQSGGMGRSIANLGTNAVGTTHFCGTKSSVSNKEVGDTVSGSNLRDQSATGEHKGSGSQSGTWKCMGYSKSGSGNFLSASGTCWVRIS